MAREPMRRLATLAVLLTACTEDGEHRQAPAHEPAGWRVTVALEVGEVLGGCAIGDVVPERPGLEIVVVAESGAVRLLSRSDDGWEAEEVLLAPGSMVQVAVGDIGDPRGDAVLVVGMREGPVGDGHGAAWVVQPHMDAWQSERILRADALVHGASVHEQALFVTGHDGKLWRFTKCLGPGWDAEEIIALPGAGVAALSTPHGVVVACTDGSLVRARRTEKGWKGELLDRRAVGRARLGSDGERLIVADDDGTLSIVADGERTVVHRAEDRLRGAVLADLVPEWPGLEAATTGSSGKVTVLRQRDGAWTGIDVLRDDGALHHLAAANLDEDPELELVACGDSGRVLVIERAR